MLVNVIEALVRGNPRRKFSLVVDVPWAVRPSSFSLKVDFSPTRTSFSLMPPSEPKFDLENLKVSPVVEKCTKVFDGLISDFLERVIHRRHGFLADKFLVVFLKHRYLLPSVGDVIKAEVVRNFMGKSQVVALSFIESPEVPKYYLSRKLGVSNACLSNLKRRVLERLRYMVKPGIGTEFLEVCNELWRYRIYTRKVRERRVR